DTAATTWGPVFLRSAHQAPTWLLPLATLPYLVASGATRLAGDRAVSAVGAVVLVRSGAVIAPLSFSAAATLAGHGLDARQRRARVDAVIARFNQFNYVCGLLGAVLT